MLRRRLTLVCAELSPEALVVAEMMDPDAVGIWRVGVWVCARVLRAKEARIRGVVNMVGLFLDLFVIGWFGQVGKSDLIDMLRFDTRYLFKVCSVRYRRRVIFSFERVYANEGECSERQ